MNEIQQAQIQVLALRENLREAEERLAFLRGVEAGKAQWAEAAAEREEIRQSKEEAQRAEAEAEREEKLRAAKASLAAVKANRTRKMQKAETLNGAAAE